MSRQQSNERIQKFLESVILSCETIEQFITARQWIERYVSRNYPNLNYDEILETYKICFDRLYRCS